jgi:hypothetical protein
LTVLDLPLRENVSASPDRVEIGGKTYSTVRRRVPFFVARTELYYWTRDWQAGEREALEDIAEGRVRRFPDGASAAKWLLSDED